MNSNDIFSYSKSENISILNDNISLKPNQIQAMLILSNEGKYFLDPEEMERRIYL